MSGFAGVAFISEIKFSECVVFVSFGFDEKLRKV